MNRSKKINHRIASILATLLLLGGAVVIMIPLLWTICMALKPASEMYTDNFFPKELAWGNFY